MAIRPIVITGNPVLHSRASEVTVFDDELRSLVADMYDTMDKAPGVGLAAPQIGVPLRIFVYDYADDDGTERRGVLINPTLTIGEVVDEPADEDTEVEGCLSVPGIYDGVERATQVKVKALDEHGKERTIEAEGLLAVCIQHELDHLLGKVFVEYLSPLKRNRIKTKMLKALRDDE